MSNYERVLYVSHEINPYLPENYMSYMGRQLPQEAQDFGKEIRLFMPRFGLVNERRHQLHEVIRLSGMNLIVDDTDHPLIIKVASIQPTRMQVYFIDNEEYFRRKATFWDEDDNFFEDNDERSIFFSRGVFETVKKLGWMPDIIHINGWFSVPMALFQKTFYADDPLFADAKVVFSIYGEEFEEKLNNRFWEKCLYDNMTEEDVELIKDDPSYTNVCKLGARYADAIVFASDDINDDIRSYVESLDKPVLDAQPEENLMSVFDDFYTEVMESNTVMAQ
ncbi:MAG: glycogen/starch synthase [Salibacteraceae bacterium]